MTYQYDHPRKPDPETGCGLIIVAGVILVALEVIVGALFGWHFLAALIAISIMALIALLVLPGPKSS